MEFNSREPVWGCILIGGKSSRMGSPKHLITYEDGRTWLEQAVNRLQPHVANIVLSGSGEVPAVLGDIERIEDLPGVSGPMSGIISALRRYPQVSWLLLACDMPEVTSESIDWLLRQRQPGSVAVIPKNPLSGRSEPLFAWYDFRCLPLLEEMLGSGERRIRRICQRPGINQPEIPQSLCGAWCNVNKPEELGFRNQADPS